jgi:hypothetical protein
LMARLRRQVTGRTGHIELAQFHPNKKEPAEVAEGPASAGFPTQLRTDGQEL